MKWLYRIGLVLIGCYIESAIRSFSGLVLFWMQKPTLLQGFVPYLVPVVIGYLCLIDLEKHWSESRLKNDVMAYAVSVLLLGYPTLIALSLTMNPAPGDPMARRVRDIAVAALALGLATVFVVGRRALGRGVPLSLPWGTESGGVAPTIFEDADYGEEVAPPADVIPDAEEPGDVSGADAVPDTEGPGDALVADPDAEVEIKADSEQVSPGQPVEPDRGTSSG